MVQEEAAIATSMRHAPPLPKTTTDTTHVRQRLLVRVGQRHVEVRVDGVERVPDQEHGAVRGEAPVAVALGPVRLDHPRPVVHDPFPPQPLPEEAPAQDAIGPRVAAGDNACHPLKQPAQHGVARAGVAHQGLSGGCRRDGEATDSQGAVRPSNHPGWTDTRVPTTVSRRSPGCKKRGRST